MYRIGHLFERRLLGTLTILAQDGGRPLNQVVSWWQRTGMCAARNRFRRSVLASRFWGAGGRRGSFSTGSCLIPGRDEHVSHGEDGSGVRCLRQSHAHVIGDQRHVAAGSPLCGTTQGGCVGPALNGVCTGLPTRYSRQQAVAWETEDAAASSPV